jgi:hypothetical protein
MHLLELWDEPIGSLCEVDESSSESLRIGYMIVISLAIEIRLHYESISLERSQRLVDHRSVISRLAYDICYELIWV